MLAGKDPEADSGREYEWARKLGAVARELHADPDEQRTLARIVRAAVATVAGADDGSVTQLRDRAFRVQEVCDSVARDCDQLQVKLGQGPCWDVVRYQESVVAADLATETRWPNFSARTAELGLSGVLSLRLHVGGDTLGTLNLYGRSGHSFCERTRQLGEIFAVHAAVALAGARHVHHMNTALSSREMIGQAQGILMERYCVSADRAFALLV